MKVSFIVIFALAYFAATNAHPAQKNKRDTEEVEFIPLEDQNGGQPVVATGVIGGPLYNPFDGLFESLAGMMARMRQQMEYLLRKFPSGGNGTVEAFPGFPEIDLGKGNTTSVTKVIDGHKVVINETEYRQDGDLGGAFFKVRIIDVQPDSSELTTEKDAEAITSKDTESVENSFENEIPKNRETEVLRNIETFDEPDNVESFERITNWNKIEPFESIEDNSIESIYPPRDLSRDIYVNELMADAGAPTNPDAEVFNNFESNVPYVTGNRHFDKIVSPR